MAATAAMPAAVADRSHQPAQTKQRAGVARKHHPQSQHRGGQRRAGPHRQHQPPPRPLSAAAITAVAMTAAYTSVRPDSTSAACGQAAQVIESRPRQPSATSATGPETCHGERFRPGPIATAATNASRHEHPSDSPAVDRVPAALESEPQAGDHRDERRHHPEGVRSAKHCDTLRHAKASRNWSRLGREKLAMSPAT